MLKGLALMAYVATREASHGGWYDVRMNAIHWWTHPLTPEASRHHARPIGSFHLDRDACCITRIEYDEGWDLEYLRLELRILEERVLAVTDTLRGALRSRGYTVLSPDEPAERAGITTVRTRRDPVDAVSQLGEARVLASPRGGGVRLSPHFYCNDDDVERCLDALDAAT